MPTAPIAQAQGPGGLAQRHLEALGVLVEPGRDAPEQPGGARAEHAEPEPLDVGRAGIEAERVDDIVGPGPHGQGVALEGDQGLHVATTFPAQRIYLIYYMVSQ